MRKWKWWGKVWQDSHKNPGRKKTEILVVWRSAMRRWASFITYHVKTSCYHIAFFHHVIKNEVVKRWKLDQFSGWKHTSMDSMDKHGQSHQKFSRIFHIIVEFIEEYLWGWQNFVILFWVQFNLGLSNPIIREESYWLWPNPQKDCPVYVLLLIQ